MCFESNVPSLCYLSMFYKTYKRLPYLVWNKTKTWQP